MTNENNRYSTTTQTVRNHGSLRHLGTGQQQQQQALNFAVALFLGLKAVWFYAWKPLSPLSLLLEIVPRHAQYQLTCPFSPLLC